MTLNRINGVTVMRSRIVSVALIERQRIVIAKLKCTKIVLREDGFETTRQDVNDFRLLWCASHIQVP